MKPECQTVVDCQTTLATGWLSVVVSAAGTLAAVIDPRPDLAVPARTQRIPYAWWW